MPAPRSAQPPEWPRLMRAETLAAYLDIKTMPTFYRKLKAWEKLGFPEKRPDSDKWDRRAVDRFFDKISGLVDPDQDDDELDREFGIGNRGST